MRRTKTRPGGGPCLTQPSRAHTRTNAQDPGGASFDLKGEVSASTRTSPGAPAKAHVERLTQRETGRMSDCFRTRQPTTAHAAKDRRWGDPPGTTPSRSCKRVRRRGNPVSIPHQGPAAGTMSPVLRGLPPVPRSRPVNGGPSPRDGERHHGVGKADQILRATGPDEAQRTTRGHKAAPRGTFPATTKAHGQVPSNNSHRLLQTREARTTHNEPRHWSRCQATPNPHTTNPSQDWRGTGGARKQTHTPQHTSQEWRSPAGPRT